MCSSDLVVRNLSHHEKELLPPLTLASLPVFVVFFTIAGASVQLDALLGVLPIALALCSARALGYWLAARVGNRIGGRAHHFVQCHLCSNLHDLLSTQ